MKHENIQAIWHKLTRHGIVDCYNGNICPNLYYFVFRMSQNNAQCPNNIKENDPLYYKAVYDSETNTFTEKACVIYVNPPANSFLALGSHKLRLSTIKNLTPEKLTKRLQQVVDKLIIPNIGELSNSQVILMEIYKGLHCGENVGS